MSGPEDRLAADERRALRARAHALDPVVRIGTEGLSEAVIAEIERALAAHALIKVHAAGLARGERETALAAICARCAAQAVQHIGKVLVVYRRKPEPARTAVARPVSASRPRSKGSPRAGRGKRPASRRRS